MKYLNFDALELATDDFFQSWVVSPTQESSTFWNDFLKENPSKEEIVAEARALVLSLNIRDEKKIDQDQLNRVKDKVLSSVRIKEKNEQPLSFKRLVPIAASLIILLVASYFFTNLDWNQKETIQTASIKYTEKIAGRGQKSTIKLPDGSTVKLNSESKLRIPDNFGLKDRTVFLEGEAFFSVERDTTRPFRIITNDISTQVLGTSFNVNAYDISNISVAVVTGKVAVKNNKKKNEIKLLPGEMVKAKNGAIGDKLIFEKEVIAWNEGILVFKESSLSEIAIKLERWFDVTIEIEKNVTQEVKYTGKFDNENLENILSAIGEISKFQFNLKGREVLIYN